jgi:hypothetical protein
MTVSWTSATNPIANGGFRIKRVLVDTSNPTPVTVAAVAGNARTYTDLSGQAGNYYGYAVESWEGAVSPLQSSTQVGQFNSKQTCVTGYSAPVQVTNGSPISVNVSNTPNVQASGTVQVKGLDAFCGTPPCAVETQYRGTQSVTSSVTNAVEVKGIAASCAVPPCPVPVSGAAGGGGLSADDSDNLETVAYQTVRQARASVLSSGLSIFLLAGLVVFALPRFR